MWEEKHTQTSLLKVTTCANSSPVSPQTFSPIAVTNCLKGPRRTGRLTGTTCRS